MWFTNLYLYRLTKPLALSAEVLEQHLAADAFRECGSLQAQSMGWTPALDGDSQTLVHAADGRMLIRLRVQERVLPAAAVKEEVELRAEAIEARSGQPLGRKARTELRDQVTREFLPRAFTRSTYLRAYLAPAEGWLVVDAATPRKAETLSELLRRSLGSLPVTPPRVQASPAAVMTRWLEGEAIPGEIELGDECELRDPAEEGGVVRCRRQDLGADEVRAHLKAGKQAVRLALEWDERLSFVLGEDLSIKRLRFADVVKESLDGLEEQDRLAVADAEFALMGLELSRLLPSLLGLFGGEEQAGETHGESRAAA